MDELSHPSRRLLLAYAKLTAMAAAVCALGASAFLWFQRPDTAETEQISANPTALTEFDNAAGRRDVPTESKNLANLGQDASTNDKMDLSGAGAAASIESRAVNSAPSDPPTQQSTSDILFECKMALGSWALQEKRYAMAAAYANDALSHKPDSVAAADLIKKAQERWIASEREIKVAYQLEFEKVRAALEQNNVAGAEARLDALDIESDDLASLRRQIAERKEAVRKQSEYKDFIDRSRAGLAEGDFMAAASLAQRALRLQPDDPVANQLKAEALRLYELSEQP